MNEKRAATDFPIHALLADRFSPYAFADRAVADADLYALFEAARWSASSYNEQPWSFLVAPREDTAEFERLLSCLVEPNREWAKYAPVLALSVVSERLARNGKPNRVAAHDLGLATASLTVEATARGLCVHAMAGILQDRARELYLVPGHHEVCTGLAIGYQGEQPGMPDALRERDRAPRARKPLREFVFRGRWGEAARSVQ